MPVLQWDAADATPRALDSTSLLKRVLIPINSTSSPGLVAASKQDPWIESSKYALGWVYFCLIVLVFTMIIRFYHLWTDKIRTALHQEELESSSTSSPDPEYEMKALDTGNTVAKLFPREKPREAKAQSNVSSIALLNNAIALCRFIFYRPLPILKWKKHTLAFPSAGVILIMSSALIFTTLYCFLPQPLFYATIRYGSPPLAIRSGMMAVAMMPWIIAMSMKANLVTLLTGIGHERLNVLHRWGGYLCLFLSLVHTIPFYIQPVWDQGGLAIFRTYFTGHYYIYGTGKSCRFHHAFFLGTC